MNKFKYELGTKVMAAIASPRNAESFGSLLLYKIIARVTHESIGGIELSYQLRQVNVRDGTIHGLIQVEEESLQSVDEYNATLEAKRTTK